MAYTPKTWVCGETITADGLNNIEEGVQEALECCEDKGFECSETITDYYDGTIISPTSSEEAPATINVFINSSQITVIFDGTKYEMNGTDVSGGTGQSFTYGDWGQFTNYPLYIYSSGGISTIYTETPGEHTIKIQSIESTINMTELRKSRAKGKLEKQQQYRLLWQCYYESRINYY